MGEWRRGAEAIASQSRRCPRRTRHRVGHFATQTLDPGQRRQAGARRRRDGDYDVDSTARRGAKVGSGPDEELSAQCPDDRAEVSALLGHG